MEINDPWLARIVRRVDAGKVIEDTFDFDETSETDNGDSDDGKIEALTDLICRAGDEPETKAAALVVLMATVERSKHPKALANTAKHCAYIRCGEMNLHGMVDAQVELMERELFAGKSLS